MAKRLKKEVIPNPIFHYDIIVVVTDDYNAAVKKLELELSHEGYGEETKAVHIFIPDNGESYLLFHKNADAGTVVHEVWHAVRRMLEYIGAGLDNEVVAYMLGYYTRVVLDILKKAK
jgi:hypothetical protein